MSVARCARSAPSAEPLTKMIRSAEVSRCLTASAPRSTIRESITGTTTIAVARLRSRLSSVTSGSNRRRTTSVDPSPTPTIACMNPSAWYIGTHSSVTSRERNGTLLSRPPISDSECGSARGAPLGVPVVPLVKIVIRGHESGLGGGGRIAGVDQRVERVVPGLVRPGAVAPPLRIVDALERLRVLLVVDEQIGPLARRHLPDLGPGKRGVEQDDARATLGRGEHRLEEAAVIAREDRDPLPGLEPSLAPGVRERIRALVELLVGQLAALVDHHGAVAVTERAGHDRTADQAIALESAHQGGEALRRLGTEQPAADGDRGEVRLVAGAPRELGRAPDQPLGVTRGVDDRLWVQIDDGTLLLRQAPFDFSWNFGFSGRFPRLVASGRLSTARGFKDMHTARRPRIFALHTSGSGPAANSLQLLQR